MSPQNQALRLLSTFIVTLLILPSLALADTVPTIHSGDTAWMITATAFVLMMLIPGLALFYGGLVRKENVLAIYAQSFATSCIICVLWVVVGYTLVFSEGNLFTGGLSNLFLKNVKIDSINSAAGTIPETVYVMFQMTFAAITPALMLGSIADRIKFSSMIVMVATWSIVVYCPIAHWLWGPNGFLGSVGVFGFGPVLDYADGLVVHVSSGLSALVAVIVMGKRKPLGKSDSAPYNLVYSLIGAALLWVGWTGFNAGSAVSAGNNAGMAMLVSYVAATAALAWMAMEWKSKGKPSIVGIISGSVAGLVAITPASGLVGLQGALIIGLAVGIVCFIGCTTIKEKFGYDDSLDAFGVHGIGGALGSILTGVFVVKDINSTNHIGGLLEGNTKALYAQLAGTGIVVVYTFVAAFILFKIIDKVMGLRVSEEVELNGLDEHLHGNKV